MLQVPMIVTMMTSLRHVPHEKGNHRPASYSLASYVAPQSAGKLAIQRLQRVSTCCQSQRQHNWHRQSPTAAIVRNVMDNFTAVTEWLAEEQQKLHGGGSR